MFHKYLLIMNTTVVPMTNGTSTKNASPKASIPTIHVVSANTTPPRKSPPLNLDCTNEATRAPPRTFSEFSNPDPRRGYSIEVIPATNTTTAVVITAPRTAFPKLPLSIDDN